jgi:hypothetical protein
MGVGIVGGIRGSIGGWYWPAHDPDFPESEFRLLTFGGALSGYPVIRDNFRLGLLAAYRHYIWQDRSIYRFDRSIRTYRLELRVERLFSNAAIWLGPTYRVDDLLTFRGGRVRFDAESIDNLGLATGGSILLAKHYLPFAEIAYVSGIQVHIGLSYQL